MSPFSFAIIKENQLETEMAGTGRVRLTESDHISRIAEIIKSIPTLKFNKILNYVDGRSKISITCNVCNITSETCNIDNFYKRKRCPNCSLSKKGKATLKTQDEYEKTIKEFIINTNSKYVYKNFVYYKTKKDSRISLWCDKHNLNFVMSIDNFLKGRGCAECGKERTTKSKVKSEQVHIDKFIEIHGDKYSYDNFIWNGVQGKSLFTCNVHNYTFEKTPCNFRKNREHCPLCTGEVDINTIPTEFYIQRITKDGFVFCKLGISTDTHRRMLQQKWQSGAKHELLWKKTFPTRIEALKLERLLMESIERGVVDSSVLPDGFTETFDEKYLSIVLEIVNSFEYPDKSD